MGGESLMDRIIVGAVVFAAACFGWYCYFYQKEKKLLTRLQNMLSQAESGTLNQQTFSEEMLSSIESQFQKFLGCSLLEKENQREQKQIIQGLISDISHQTLTPISNLKLYAELLNESVGKDTEWYPITDTLLEQTEKLDFLIQSLVHLSRMETGIIGVHPKQEMIQSLFQSIQQEYNEKASGKNISLYISDTDLEAVFDLKWTSEALGNIVDNAIKYTPSGGSVSVSAVGYSFFVRINIADTGIGIAHDEFTKIFERFYRSFATEDQAGVGIGLYLAREVIQAQKGYIKIASTIGKGSTFSVFLPAVHPKKEIY